MACKETSIQLDQSVIETVRRRMENGQKQYNEIFCLESRIRQDLYRDRLCHLERIAATFGVELRNFQEDVKRENSVKSRIVQKEYDQFLRQTKERVREEMDLQSGIRERYLDLYGESIQRRQGNPELKFLEHVPGGHWADFYQDPPGGMSGGSAWHEARLSRHEHSDHIEVGFTDTNRHAHCFLPRVFVATGEDDLDVYGRLVQALFLRRPALESGRGNFLVERIRVDLSGVGYSQARVGDPEWSVLIDSGGSRTGTTEMRLRLAIYQATPTGLLETQIFGSPYIAGNGVACDYPYFLLNGGANSHSHPLHINLGASINPHDFRILNPDNGGSEPWLLVILETSAKAEDHDAFAEINFSRPDSEGLKLGCVTLLGGYEV